MKLPKLSRRARGRRFVYPSKREARQAFRTLASESPKA